MRQELLYEVPQWLLVVALVGLVLGSAELAFRFGRRRREPAADESATGLNTALAAALGLLALLLGFTYTMSSARYESRRQLVVDESNAIGTAFLRTELLPEPGRSELARLFPGYLKARIVLSEQGLERAASLGVLHDSERLQSEIWSRAAAAARDDPHAIARGLLVQAVNAMIDIGATRVAALQNHVPEIVIVLLFIVSVACFAFIGFVSGLARRREAASWLVLSLLVAAVVFVILDLDRPGRGLILVPSAPLKTLERSMRG